jgi:hypothetical protein
LEPKLKLFGMKDLKIMTYFQAQFYSKVYDNIRPEKALEEKTPWTVPA